MHHPGAAAGIFLLTQRLRQLICQLVRLFINRLRQTCLLQQHRDGVGLGSAIRGGDGGAVYRLRQDLLGKIEKRLVDLFNRRDVFLMLSGIAEQGRDLSNGLVAFQPLQIIKNRLLDQPVRCAIDTICRRFNPLARGVVKFDPHGGRPHALLLLFCTLWQKTIGHVATLCNLVKCDGGSKAENRLNVNYKLLLLPPPGRSLSVVLCVG